MKVFWTFEETSYSLVNSFQSVIDTLCWEIELEIKECNSLSDFRKSCFNEKFLNSEFPNLELNKLFEVLIESVTHSEILYMFYILLENIQNEFKIAKHQKFFHSFIMSGPHGHPHGLPHGPPPPGPPPHCGPHPGPPPHCGPHPGPHPGPPRRY